jgi:hypothetical protein
MQVRTSVVVTLADDEQFPVASGRPGSDWRARTVTWSPDDGPSTVSLGCVTGHGGDPSSTTVLVHVPVPFEGLPSAVQDAVREACARIDAVRVSL